MTQWEYEVMSLEEDPSFPDEMAKLGAEGWEAFHVERFGCAEDWDRIVVWLKRPKVSGEFAKEVAQAIMDAPVRPGYRADPDSFRASFAPRGAASG